MSQRRYVQALNEALHDAFERDESVIMIGEDIRGNMRGEARGLFDRFGPMRVRDTPISEAAFTGFATGAAMAGLRPIVEYQIASLVYVSFDQLVNQAAKLRFMTGGQTKIPVTYLIMATGITGNTAGQHSDNPYPLLAHGGMKVAVPSSAADVKGIAATAILDDDPVAICCPAALLGVRGEVPETDYGIPFGVGEVKRSGTDVTVVAVGHVVQIALRVAEAMEKRGVSVHVWDPRTLLPLDRDGLLEAAATTGRVIICDDSNPVCGFASELSAIISEFGFETLTAPIRRVARAHVPAPFSPPLEKEGAVTEEKLTSAIETLLD